MTMEQLEAALKRWDVAEEAHREAVRRFIAVWWSEAPATDWTRPDQLTPEGLAELDELRREADDARVAVVALYPRTFG
jgi:ferric-dicitrate binding protein FerR (iron transport regulator)